MPPCPLPIEARRQEGGITKNMNWDVYIDSWGERPEVDKDALRAASGRQEVIEQAEQQADRARDVAIIAGMQSYEGPLNRRGKPRMRPLRQHLEEYDLGYITRAERNELWGKGGRMKTCPDCKKPIGQLCRFRCYGCGAPACIDTCIGEGIE